MHDLYLISFDINVLVELTTNENEREMENESREKHLFEQNEYVFAWWHPQ